MSLMMPMRPKIDVGRPKIDFDVHDALDRAWQLATIQLDFQMPERFDLGFVDSDGDVTLLIEWLKEVGIEGILPLERMAGVDVARIRKHHPDFKMLGAFDKTVMHMGVDAMRREFERLLPVMKQGGFIPSVDHQTPPEVSLEQYRCYVSLLKEYCRKAAQ